MDLFVSHRALSTHERDHLARLLAALPAGEEWAVRHRHGPLLCALGLIDAPDAAYAHAADRLFADPDHTRSRALALLEQLERADRDERYEQRHRRSARGA
jgi:hypothetical protein